MELQTHDIVTSNYENGELKNKHCCGYAYKKDGEDFYTIKLYMNPKQNYYLFKNKHNELYSIFSKIEKEENFIKPKQRVGYAKLLPDNKSFMQIKFYLPKMIMFMDLFVNQLKPKRLTYKIAESLFVERSF